MINSLIYIVSTLFTYFLGLASKKFKWNEELPIPVQNIIVGFIVFIIAFFITKPENTEEFLNQFIIALGGSGTATLGYDASKIGKED